LFQFAKYFIRQTSRALAGLDETRRMLATASKWLTTSWYVLAAWLLPFTVSMGGRPVFSIRFIKPEEFS